MAAVDKVTVDKAYFDALLRRADFHTTAQNTSGRPDPTNVTIARAEYENLLRISREYEQLRLNLFQGGITAETLGVLVADTSAGAGRKDSGASWTDDYTDPLPSPHRATFQLRNETSARGTKQNVLINNDTSHPSTRPTGRYTQNFTRDHGYSNGAGDDVPGFDEADEDFNEETYYPGTNGSAQRTLYFCGLSDRTTYRDLLSVIRGSRILSVNMRGERSATVTFLDGAADFLAWAKKNDIYLHSKRIEVRWAERQYNLNKHIASKITNGGATRNIHIHLAQERGFTEAQIRADMEHIHNLVVIDVTFRNGDAYVSMNSIHNALFARTCMLSRSTYKGCKIEFYRDECDVPLPIHVNRSRVPAPEHMVRQGGKKAGKGGGGRPGLVRLLSNRFDLLNASGDGDGSDEDDTTLSTEDESEDGTIGLNGATGVRLGSESDGRR